uniref:Sedoheptulokinase-like n=1 Tax=Phallusia mammillata TaxID=59560 RepID=A0A6F9DSB3_9ASCI|nr:sedoheptulokinase-like [Phallusia mammillata]
MYSLGIDIGTTSVKVTIVNNENSVIASKSLFSNANIESKLYPDHIEQSVSKIFETLDKSLCAISQEIGQEIKHVKHIVVCGQMHGCVLWDSNTRHQIQNSCENVSNLITWRDQRCTVEFLESLPVSQNSTNLSTGFGCATLLWMRQNCCKFLEKFDSCGTIADYVVAVLTGCSKRLMCYQNANSWGYFNVQSQKWDLSVMREANFPLEILPEVVAPGTIVGKLAHQWHGIPTEAHVYVALGDLQCSVMACKPKENEAVVNVSTSAQISMAVQHETLAIHRPQDDSGKSPVVRVPYFGDRDLITYASLNGGAVFAEYVRLLRDWTQKFVPDVTEGDIYSRLLEETSEQHADSGNKRKMTFSPTLFGERHAPDLKAALHNIDAPHFNAPEIGRAIAAGILRNLRSVFDSGTRNELLKVAHVWACGSVFTRNRFFREEITASVFDDVNVSFSRNADAAYGAAISIISEVAMK